MVWEWYFVIVTNTPEWRPFNEIFRLSSRTHSPVFIQDGDPSQNSASAKRGLNSIGAQVFSIPPRSPDLNPIENLFHLVKKSLTKEAIEKRITYKLVDNYASHIEDCFLDFDKTYIDKLISTMPKRINFIIKNRGGRTRY